MLATNLCESHDALQRLGILKTLEGTLVNSVNAGPPKVEEAYSTESGRDLNSADPRQPRIA